MYSIHFGEFDKSWTECMGPGKRIFTEQVTVSGLTTEQMLSFFKRLPRVNKDGFLDEMLHKEERPRTFVKGEFLGYRITKDA